VDTDGSASRPVARGRAARLAAGWATPLSILAGAVSVLWSARHVAVRPCAQTAPPKSPEPPKPLEPPATGREHTSGPAEKSRLAKVIEISATPLSILIAAGGLFWSVHQFSAQQHANLVQQRLTQEQALDQQRQTTLNNYLNEMSSLLLSEKLDSAPSKGPVRAIAVAQTDTAIRNLDSNRKATLVRFLWEANLINSPDPVVQLYQVNLRAAAFAGANLQHADLSDNNLYGAVFTDAQLNNSDLSNVNLVRADLVNANLAGADLVNANLSCFSQAGGVVFMCDGDRGADLEGADLSNANLSGADLEGANLSQADLFGARVTSGQLAEARSVRGAMLPNGSVDK
jgi:uncharacterized protein YjbI with pentapeptide repeats